MPLGAAAPGGGSPAGDGGRERWRLLVSGRVQGVGYRAATCARAQDLGLAGWVRNRPDGRVEMEAEGEPRQLLALRRWCERGPELALVEAVAVQRTACTGAVGFTVRR